MSTIQEKQKRPEKVAIFREVTELLKGKDFAFLVNFGGLTVDQLAALRSQLSAKEARVAVVKNTYIAKAAKELGWDDLSEMLAGPTAIVVGSGDVADTAKTLIDFIKKHDKASVKGGQLEKRAITEVEVNQLSELISLAAQRARLLGTMQAPASQMARVLQAKIDAEGGAPAEAAPAAEEAPAAEASAPAAEGEAAPEA